MRMCLYIYPRRKAHTTHGCVPIHEEMLSLSCTRQLFITRNTCASVYWTLDWIKIRVFTVCI